MTFSVAYFCLIGSSFPITRVLMMHVTENARMTLEVAKGERKMVPQSVGKAPSRA